MGRFTTRSSISRSLRRRDAAVVGRVFWTGAIEHLTGITRPDSTTTIGMAREIRLTIKAALQMLDLKAPAVRDAGGKPDPEPSLKASALLDAAPMDVLAIEDSHPGVRAALCPDVFSAYNARAHNDANVLTLGSRTMGIESAKRVLAEFLSVAFEGGRHEARVQKIQDVEARFFPGR